MPDFITFWILTLFASMCAGLFIKGLEWGGPWDTWANIIIVLSLSLIGALSVLDAVISA